MSMQSVILRLYVDAYRLEIGLFMTNAIVRTDLGLLLTDNDFMIHHRTSGDIYTVCQGWMVDKSDQWKHGKILTIFMI